MILFLPELRSKFVEIGFNSLISLPHDSDPCLSFHHPCTINTSTTLHLKIIKYKNSRALSTKLVTSLIYIYIHSVKDFPSLGIFFYSSFREKSIKCVSIPNFCCTKKFETEGNWWACFIPGTTWHLKELQAHLEQSRRTSLRERHCPRLNLLISIAEYWYYLPVLISVLCFNFFNSLVHASKD